MRIGVLGLGFMGSAHLQALARIPGVEVAAVMSRSEKRLAGDLEDVGGNLGMDARKFDLAGARKYRDVDAILSDPDLDAVDICLPTNLHAPAAIQAVRNGKHVLVEKPMAVDGASADEMCRAAEAAGRTLMVAHVLRFMSPYRELGALVRSERLGRIHSAMFRRRTAVPEWGPWEFDRSQSGGGVFDLLIHDVDIALHLFGLPEAITSSGYEDLTGGVDMVTSQFHTQNVDSMTISGGWHHRGEYPFSMEYTVVAQNGVVEFSSAGRPATVYWKDRAKEELPCDTADPYQAQIEYFVECCRTGQHPAACPPEESALAVKVARAMVDARDRKGDKVLCEFREKWKSA